MAYDFGAGDNTLIDGANKVSAARGDFTKLASNLDNQIRGMQSQWKGEASQAFFALHQGWMEKQNKIVSALDHFEESLRSTQKDNTAADTTSNQAMAKLHGRMGG